MGTDRRLLLVYAIIFVDVIVGSAVAPVLPAFVNDYSHPELWLALGTGLFLGVQLMSAPITGQVVRWIRPTAHFRHFSNWDATG